MICSYTRIMISALALFLCSGTAFSEDLNQLDAAKLSSFLQTMIEDTGWKFIQDKYDENPYNVETLKGDLLIQELAPTVADRFKNNIDVVRKLRDRVVKQYGDLTSIPTMTECCRLPTNLELSERLKSKVDVTRMCYHKSGYADTDVNYINTELFDEMKKNYQNYPNLNWQYFGTEQGIYYNYPAFRLDHCGEYDHRYRPWYVEALTPLPKDVVIVIDKSGSMSGTHGGKTLMTIAKEAAKSVLETLNPKDRVGVAAFSSAVVTPPGNSEYGSCFNRKLAEATPQNVNYLKSYIDTVTDGGGTAYVPPLNKAFDFFKQSDALGNSVKRDKVILFLTDGVPQESQTQIVNTVKNHNAVFNNEVIVFTYGLGSGLSDGPKTILTEMTKTGNRHGHFTHVENPSKLRSAMSSYYSFFSIQSESDDAIIATPYIDAFSKTLITSIVLPVHVNGKLVGVVGGDLNMAELLGDITYFRKGEFSYAFMADQFGRTLMHPYLPQPQEISEPPIVVHISKLEPGASEVLASMARGETGSKQLSRSISLSRGVTKLQGVNVVSKQVTYNWAPIDGTNFSVCAVIATNDKQGNLPSVVMKTSFVYHELQLQGIDDTCKFFKRYASSASSCVKFSPYAFLKPFNYLLRKENKADIDGYDLYLRGKSTTNPGFKPNVKSAVALSEVVEQFWKKKTSNSAFIVWRYFGTIEGVMRFFPATLLNKNYDHTVRPWYKRTLAHRGKNVLSAPYKDNWGSGYLVTLSRTVFQRSSSAHSPDDLVAGVIGTDFTLGSFYNKMVESSSLCSDNICFVIDDSGFLVMHEDFVKDGYLFEGVHIINKLPSIAYELIQKGYLKQEACLNFETVKYNSYWRVTLSGRYSGNQFVLEYVANTNIYLGAYKKDKNMDSAFCSCEMTYSKCKKWAQQPRGCECPCSHRAEFDYCSNKFTLTSDSRPACTPRAPENFLSITEEESKLDGLKRCVDNKCPEKNNKTRCIAFTGCYWCDGSCVYVDDKCLTDGKSGGLSTGGIVGIVIGVLVAVGLISFLSWFCCGRETGGSPTTAAPQPSHVYDNPQRVTDVERPKATPSAPAAFGEVGHGMDSRNQIYPHPSQLYNANAATVDLEYHPPDSQPPPYEFHKW